MVSLEIENAALQNSLEDLRVHQSQSEQRIQAIQKQISSYEAENISLKNALTSILEELNNFKRIASNELKDINRPDSRTEIDFDLPETAPTLTQDLTTPANRQPLRREDSTVSGFFVETKTSLEDDIDGTNMFGSPPSNSETEQRLIFDRHSSEMLERSSSSHSNPILVQNMPEVPQYDQIQPVRQNDANTTVFTPEKVFEDCLVFAPDKDQVKDYFFRQGSKKNAIFSGKDQFGLLDNLKIRQNIETFGISEVLSPNGFIATEYTSDTEIERVFSRAAFSTENCQEKYICLLESQTLLNKWAPYADAINPQHKLYAFCLKREDYYMLDSPNSEQNKLIKIDTIYCFLTYYPIPELFFKLLDSLLTGLVENRKEMYSSIETIDKKQMIDFSVLNSIFSQKMTLYLSAILNLQIPSPGASIQCPLPSGKDLQEIYQYTYPPGARAYFELATYNASKVLCMFSLENIALILNAIFLEKPLVFFSKDTRLLLSVINTLMGLIYPYKYLCNVVALLPQGRMSLCNPPVPIIVGVNKKETVFWKEKLHKDPQAIFVFIDSKVILIDEKNKNISEFPKLDFGIKSLRGLSSIIRSTGFEVVSQVQTLAERHRLKQMNEYRRGGSSRNLTAQDLDKQVIEKIFNHFRNYVETNIVGYHGALEMGMSSERIKNAVRDSNLVEFFKEWIKTMGFCNYPHVVSNG